jgi:outer membrane protein
MDEAVLVPRALNSSGERTVLMHRIEQAKTLLAIEKGARPFRPDVSLNVSLDITGQKIPVIGANWTESWDANLIITLGSSMSILDSGKSASRIDQAQRNIEIAVEGLAALEQGIEYTVRSMVEGVRSGWYETGSTAAELELSREQERNAKVSYENELITRQEYLGAQIAALSSELANLAAAYAFETALTELESLAGITLVTD